MYRLCAGEFSAGVSHTKEQTVIFVERSFRATKSLLNVLLPVGSSV